MKTFQKIAVLAVVAAGLVAGTTGQADAGFKGKFSNRNHFTGKFAGKKFDHRFTGHSFKFSNSKFQQHNFKHFHHKFDGHKFGHDFKFNPHLHFGKHK